MLVPCDPCGVIQANGWRCACCRALLPVPRGLLKRCGRDLAIAAVVVFGLALALSAAHR